MVAKVVVDIKSQNINETFDYLIPENLNEFVFIGSRVLVPFGLREVMGYVVELSDVSDYNGNLKAIKDVFSYEQELTQEQVNLAKMLSEELNAPLVSTLELMLPSFLKEQRKEYLYVNNYDALNPELALLFNGKRKIRFDASLLKYYPLIKKEIAKANMQMEYEYLVYGQHKKERFYTIKNLTTQISPIRERIVTFLQDKPEVSEDEIILATNCRKEILAKMVKDGTLGYQEKLVLNEEKTDSELTSKYHFNIDQVQLIEKFKELGHKPYLLFSNDETFKAEFYLHLINYYLKSNQQVVIFTPTIMLLEELHLYIRKNYHGLRILTYHSKNTKSENYDAFMNVKYDNFDLMLTTSMGAFLPFKKVGLMIVVDEDNPNYIYDNFPYYDVREVLKTRAVNLDAKIIFATATPSVKAYYQYHLNKYYLLEYNINHETQVYIVDMKEEMLEENNTIISKLLYNNIKQALEEKRISLLIVNNKAYSTAIKCRECGTVLSCPKCKIPLTYYKTKNIAQCNYCNYKVENFKQCSKCGSENMLSLGFGLEQVRTKLSLAFPKARIMQVDSDNIKALDDYNNVLNAIEENEVDIIVGTNFLTKTVNYDNIKVVGFLYVDSYLNVSDHRSSEYTYDLIAKMTNKDVCIIQTYNKDHYAIKYGAINDYDHFYQKEIAARELLNYEPFVEMNRITITGQFDKMYHFAYYYRKAITHLIGDNVLGPSYDAKIKGVKLIVKHNQYKEVVKVLNDAIRNFNDANLTISFERYPKGM